MPSAAGTAASSPFAAAMAPSEQALPFVFLRPIFFHDVSAAAHILLALAVVERLLFCWCRLSAGRGKDGAVGRGRGGGGFRWYGVVACTTWALAAFEVLLAAYSCYLDGGAGWSRDAVVDQVDAAARAVAWLLLAAYLQFEFGRRREERFPAPLRLWWVLFLLLSVLTVAVHAVTSLDGVPVPAHLWALDAASVVAAAVLLFAGFLGKREAGGSASEEPLLNGAHESAGENNNNNSVDVRTAASLNIQKGISD